jgi:hypothetical protein
MNVTTAISDTSPLLYLYRVGAISLLADLFDVIWVPETVITELTTGRRKGYDVPDPLRFPWTHVVNPKSMPSEWLALDLGPGELAAMALALEYPGHVILLDDMLARRTAQAAGLSVWGTLRVLLEAKSHHLITAVGPFIVRLQDAGMWISPDLMRRILTLADEIE